MELKNLITESRTAFLNGQYSKALELAQSAILMDKECSDAYSCAANASMSLEKYNQAVDYYKEAVKNDQKNGDRYFQLGYALASSDKKAEALKALSKAEELNCSKECKSDLYHIMGMICFESGRIDDALINFKRAQYIIGPDIELMGRIAVAYGMKKEMKKGLFTTNQMKLLAPSKYIGYRLAANFFVQAKQFEKAKEEYIKAEKYANITMEYYIDRMLLEVELYKKTSDKKHFIKALGLLNTGLNNMKPTVKEVIDSYVNAAEIYLQLEEPERTVECLNSALNPVESFNMGFKIIPEKYEEKPLTEYDIENMMEEDHIKNEELYGADGIEAMAERIEPDELGNRDYLTEIEDEDEEEKEKIPYKLSTNEKAEYTQETYDQINRLYLGAYTLKKDFDQIIRYSKKLQGSKSRYNEYMGRYSEAKALKDFDKPDADLEYEKLIKFYKHAMMKDPTDTFALTYRIQCLVDIKKYDDAEQLCGLLNNFLKKSTLEQIEKARSGGDQ